MGNVKVSDATVYAKQNKFVSFIYCFTCSSFSLSLLLRSRSFKRVDLQNKVEIK